VSLPCFHASQADLEGLLYSFVSTNALDMQKIRPWQLVIAKAFSEKAVCCLPNSFRPVSVMVIR